MASISCIRIKTIGCIDKDKTMTFLRSFTVHSLLVSFLVIAVVGEKIPLSVILDADSEEMHFVRVWLEAPAQIDLSHVTFLTAKESVLDDDFWNNDNDDDGGHSPGDDNFGNTDDDREIISPTEGGGEATNASEQTDEPSPAQSNAEMSDGEAQNGGGGVINGPIPPIPTPTTLPSNSSNASGTPDPSGDDSIGGGGRMLQEDASFAAAGGGAQKVKQLVEILFFRIPDNCKGNTYGGCDWETLGVGRYDAKMGMRYCCSQDAISVGSCTSDEMGRVLINYDTFIGEHRKVEVPTVPDRKFFMEDPILKTAITGDHVLMFTNCDDYGLDVFSIGSLETSSENKHYKLPGQLVRLMLFFTVLTVVYFLLVLWYWCGMKMYQDASIPIQRFILATMILAFIEIFCRALDLGIWNVDGLRSSPIIWTASVTGVLRRGISQSLLVMVAMGWGIVRDSLGLTLAKIVLLGLIYCSLTMLRDFFLVLAVEKVESWSEGTEQGLLNLTFLITMGIVVVKVIFFFWTITSLRATSEYLQNMNQSTKLRRHLQLRCIILTSFAFDIAWFTFAVADEVQGILTSNQLWFLEASMYLNNLFVICSVAILWRPNANAKEYAMQMELPSMDDDDGMNELELSCVVPSAGDDDGNDPDHANGIPVNNAVMS